MDKKNLSALFVVSVSSNHVVYNRLERARNGGVDLLRKFDNQYRPQGMWCWPLFLSFDGKNCGLQIARQLNAA